MCARLMKRRCLNPDHENPGWMKQNPEIEKQYPGGLFDADLEEERAARDYLPMPKYYSSSQFLGLCPYHRAKKWPNRFPTIAEWIKYYLKLWKDQRGLIGLDPEDVRAAGLNPKSYDDP